MILDLFRPLNSLTDEQLMQRVARKGDDRAFDELYRRHARRLMGFFFRQLRRDEALAADLTQDTFLRVWSKRERWQAEAEFLPWLFAIAYNLCKNEYRHQDYQTDFEQHLLHTQTEEQEADMELQLDSAAFDQALYELIDTLRPDMRTLFSLRFEEELTVPQIAGIIGIPQGTVKSRLYSLTQTLKQKLKLYDTI